MAEIRVNQLDLKRKVPQKFPMDLYSASGAIHTVHDEVELTRYLRTGWSNRRGAFTEITAMEEAIQKAEEELIIMKGRLKRMKEKREEEAARERAYTPPGEREEMEEGEGDAEVDDAPGASVAAAAQKVDNPPSPPPAPSKYVCSICDRDCQNAAALSAHMRKHTADIKADDEKRGKGGEE